MRAVSTPGFDSVKQGRPRLSKHQAAAGCGYAHEHSGTVSSSAAMGAVQT